MAIQYELSYIKQHYRDMFHAAHQQVLEGLLRLKAEFACPQCNPIAHEEIRTKEIATEAALSPLFESLHAQCGYAGWKTASLDWLQNTLGRSVYEKIQEINAEREKVTCHQCGVCCRFASSEFSYDELLHKAQQGDEFAHQFTSVFLPYPSVDAAQKRFPELVNSILTEVRRQQSERPDTATQSDTAPVYFYHCPYIGEDNRCTIYGMPKRPAICAGYPDTPLTFIYDKCAWKPWKDRYHQDSMATHAMIELCLFYVDKIQSA